jgi:DNA helicase IV
VREEDLTALFERDAFAYLAARRMASLHGEHEGLVFGRLDFLDQDKRYIGRLGVRTDDYEPLVIDWRAQAAEPFYRATPNQPMDVVRRRVISSRDDKVTSIEDDVLMPQAIPSDMVVIGDGALMHALQRARGGQMHDIVATIQAEQDEAIRAPYQGFTIISGGPGTGKTVVGLHRIAFLLYTYRRRFSNGGILVIGPSSIFMEYIKAVLPSLGEDAVELKSVGQVGDDVLGFGSTARDLEPAWTYKGEQAMTQVLRRLVEHSAVNRSVTVMVQGEPLTITADQLARIRHSCLTQQAYNQARASAEKRIVEHLREQGEGLIDTEDPELAEQIQDSWAYRSFIDQWWPMLEPGEVLARLRDPRLGRDVGQLSPEQADVLSRTIDPQHWTIADIALLDELAVILGPVPLAADAEPEVWSNSMKEIVSISDRLTDTRELATGVIHSTYAHILVDEAQDLTPMQWRMIHRRGPNASWTILGDPAQSSWHDRSEPARALRHLIGSRQQRTFHLSTNYRSPKEVHDLAAKYIRRTEPDASIPQAVRATGIQPELLVAPSATADQFVAARAADLLQSVEGTVGVIADPSRIAALASASAPDPRLQILDPWSAKGLEFDAVIVVDPDQIVAESPSGARVLYVGLTRPTQRLVTIDLDHEGQWRQGLI